MEVEEYRKMYWDIEAVYSRIITDSNLKSISHKYFLDPQEKKLIERVYYIVAAELRQGIEKVFDKYIDNAVELAAQFEAAKRKRGPRQKVLQSSSEEVNEVDWSAK